MKICESGHIAKNAAFPAIQYVQYTTVTVQRYGQKCKMNMGRYRIK